VSRQLVRHSPRPVILAGGLNPSNVRDAILAVRPAGVDAHTGLEDVSGRKSEEKVKKFIGEAQEAFRLIREAAMATVTRETDSPLVHDGAEAGRRV